MGKTRISSAKHSSRFPGMRTPPSTGASALPASCLGAVAAVTSDRLQPAAVISIAANATATTDYDKGNAVLRVLVGMGAGQAEIRGEVEIRDRAGAVLLSFESKESYLGGSGIGGAGFVDMDDLMRRFAESAAEATVKWSRGQSIK